MYRNVLGGTVGVFPLGARATGVLSGAGDFPRVEVGARDFPGMGMETLGVGVGTLLVGCCDGERNDA